MQKEVKYVVYKEIYSEEVFNEIRGTNEYEIPGQLKKGLPPVETIVCCYTETADYAERLVYLMNNHESIPYRPFLYRYRTLENDYEKNIDIISEDKDSTI